MISQMFKPFRNLLETFMIQLENEYPDLHFESDYENYEYIVNGKGRLSLETEFRIFITNIVNAIHACDTSLNIDSEKIINEEDPVVTYDGPTDALQRYYTDDNKSKVVNLVNDLQNIKTINRSISPALSYIINDRFGYDVKSLYLIKAPSELRTVNYADSVTYVIHDDRVVRINKPRTNFIDVYIDIDSNVGIIHDPYRITHLNDCFYLRHCLIYIDGELYFPYNPCNMIQMYGIRDAKTCQCTESILFSHTDDDKFGGFTVNYNDDMESFNHKPIRAVLSSCGNGEAMYESMIESNTITCSWPVNKNRMLRLFG